MTLPLGDCILSSSQVLRLSEEVPTLFLVEEME